MNSLFLIVIMCVFAVLHGISLVAKSETIRGLGRLFLAFALIAQGFLDREIAHFLSAPNLAAVCSYLVILVGLITLGSGVHKYRRRNVAQ